MTDPLDGPARPWSRVPMTTPGLVTLLSIGGVLCLLGLPAENAGGPEVIAVNSDVIQSLSFDSDGSRLAVGGLRGAVSLWDFRTRTARTVLPAGHAPGAAPAFAPDLSAVALPGPSGPPDIPWNDPATAVDAPEPRVVVLALEPGREPRAGPIVYHDAQVLAFSPDGSCLALARKDGTVLLLDPDGQEREALGTMARGVSLLVFSPDGQYLAASDLGGTVRVWGVSGRPRGLFQLGREKPLSALAVAPGGKLLAATSPELPCPVLLDRETGQARPVVLGAGSDHGALAFSPDGATLAVTSKDGVILLWDIAGNSIRARLTGGRGPLWALAFSPDGRRLAAAGGDEGAVLLWDVRRP